MLLLSVRPRIHPTTYHGSTDNRKIIYGTLEEEEDEGYEDTGEEQTGVVTQMRHKKKGSTDRRR